MLLAIGYKIKHFHYEGVVGWEGSKMKKNIVPYWVWKKEKKDDTNKQEFYGKYLKRLYPHFYEKIRDVKYQVNNGKNKASK